jgi:hypothetical protein
VTIYCPSCGKPNTDQADKCASCGKELTKPKPAAPKFKGTMMMGAPGLKPPGAPAPGASPPAASPPAASPGPAAPSAPQGFDTATPPAGTPAMPGAGGAAGAGAPAKKNLAFQATMLGPMSAPIPPPGGGAPGQPRIPGPPPPAAGPPGGSSSAPAAPEPSASPASPAPAGGFTAPSAEPAAPASSGWGSPSGGGSAGSDAPATSSGWGSSASASSAASGAPAASGWGGAPASAPPAEGGWGGAPAAPGALGGLAANKKLLLGVAAGCLALVMLACVATAVGLFVLRSKTEQAATRFTAESTRVPLIFTLSGLQMSCASGGPKATASFFHPKALAELGDQVCKIDERAIDVFGDASQSTARVLQGTPLATKATSLGLDADSCFLYEAGDSQIAGCILDDGFKIIHMENVASL